MFRQRSTRLAAPLAAALAAPLSLGCDPGPNRVGNEPRIERLSEPDHPEVTDVPRGQHVEPDHDPAPPAQPTFPKDVARETPNP